MQGHVPVLANETLEMLDVREDGVYLDMTLGGFGHGALICERLSRDGTYIGLDLDAAAIERTGKVTGPYENRIILVQTHFKRFAETLAEHGIHKIDGVLMDLGVSSFQLDEAGRGFSFSKESFPDMRMDLNSPMRAGDIVNEYSQDALKKIFLEYGEERFAGAVSRAIVRERAKARVSTALDSFATTPATSG